MEGKRLKTADIFAFVRLCFKIGVKDDIKQLASKSNNAIDVWNNGFELMSGVAEKFFLKQNEKDVFLFFGGVLEISQEEVAKMDAIELMETLLQIASLEEWKLFFSRAAKLIT